MAAFNFPNSPSTNDTHTENGVEWKWNGSVWKRVEGVGEKGQKEELISDPENNKLFKIFFLPYLAERINGVIWNSFSAE